MPIPKFKRPEGHNPRPLQLQERDIEILDLCYQHRFLSSDQIYALVGGSPHRLKQRLQLLWLHRFLDRPPDQQILQVREKLHYLIYALGDKGAEVLAEKRGYDLEKIRWSRKNDQARFPYLKHAMKISYFYACLALTLREQPELQLLSWRQGREIHDRIELPPYIDFNDVRADFPTIRPDALFGLYYLRDQQRQYFFLEMDLGTVRERAMLTRYRKYWAYWQQRRFTKQGIPENLGFRVLTVCYNPARTENLRNLIKNHEPWQGKTSMFWFTTEQWSLAKPDPILAKIWKTANDEQLHSLRD
jgi:hypothetical protein